MEVDDDMDQQYGSNVESYSLNEYKLRRIAPHFQDKEECNMSFRRWILKMQDSDIVQDVDESMKLFHDEFIESQFT